MNILNNATISGRLHVPEWERIVDAVSYDVLREIAVHAQNTSEEDVFRYMDTIGIMAIANVVAQGAFLGDLAASLDLPIIYILRWVRADSSRMDVMDIADKCAAEADLSVARRMIMGIKSTDADGIKVAKAKADLMKWIASRRDREKYGDRVVAQGNEATLIQFNITMSGPAAEDRKVIEI